MANIPTPRSFPQTVGDMIDTFLSKVDLPALKVGSPVLAILEAAAQSDVRSSQDVFDLLNAVSLDRATGTALDRLGLDEDLPRITESAASGMVTVSDTSFAKIVSRVYQGMPSPIVGSTVLYVADASQFPASGNVYIGRGTTNYEGPLAYTSKVSAGNYWTLTLAGGNQTKRFHNLNEPVVLAQGGDRVIDAGSIVETSTSNLSDAARFSTLYVATIPDGETSVEGVAVLAQRPGVSGNVSAGAINRFASSPFSGAAVSNPLPLTNAQATEDDRAYRERIRAARQSRSKGTRLAIKTAVEGRTAADENKRIASASVVVREGKATTLYIDDGTGYEERTEGIALETLADAALGGEDFFEVAATKPVSKAASTTTLSSPFSLVTGATLSVRVGGSLYKHTFGASEFRNIANAAADEIVASINGNAALGFSARGSDNGTRVTLFARTDVNEDIEVVAGEDDEIDANVFLGLPAGRQDTLRLYKNDRLLSKDGASAVILSEPQGSWSAATGNQTLTVQVDDTPATTYTFSDADFVTGGTGYSSLSSSNSLASWATVINRKVPGVTATAMSGRLSIASNRGASSAARVAVTGGTLISVVRMFSGAVSSQGAAKDYVFNRNTGQVNLSVPLSAGDTLVAGSTSTRGFIESGAMGTFSLASPADLWFVVDGSASQVAVNVAATSMVTIAEYNPTPDTTWGARVRVSVTTGDFLGIAPGDWAIFTGFAAANNGAFRVAEVDVAGAWFTIERVQTAWAAQGATAMGSRGLSFVRATTPVQKVTVAAGSNYTAASIADEINKSLLGASATVYKTDRIRVRTNSFASSGNVALVAQSAEASPLRLPSSSFVSSLLSHRASVRSNGNGIGTPNLGVASVASINGFGDVQFTASDSTGNQNTRVLLFGRPVSDLNGGVPLARWSNKGFHSPVVGGTAIGIRPRRTTPEPLLVGTRTFFVSGFRFSAYDDLTVVVDGDTASKRYTTNLYRKVRPVSATNATSMAYADADNGGASLAAAFGLNFDWNDFLLLRSARTKSHAESNTDTTRTVLWRHRRIGWDGSNSRLRYVYPTAPNQGVTASVVVGTSVYPYIDIRLPSGPARIGPALRSTTRIGTYSTGTGVRTLTYVFALATSAAARESRLDFAGQTGGFANGETVTGATSGATATISSQEDLGTNGRLTLTAISGTFLPGETISTVSGSAIAVGSLYGYTTLTVTLPPSATTHGVGVGAMVYLSSTSGSFASGTYTVAGTTATTLSYRDILASSVSTGASVGTVSLDVNAVTLSGTTVAANDIVTLKDTALPAAFQVTGRITALTATYITVLAESTAVAGTTPTWTEVVNPDGISFYPINSSTNTAAQIAASINTLADADPAFPVTAVAVGVDGVATGQISRASYDEFNTPDYFYAMGNAVSQVDSFTAPASEAGHYIFNVLSVPSSLVSNIDLLNEDVRLVPTTAKNVADLLSAAAMGGLSNSAEVSTSDDSKHVQFTSLTQGSKGSIEVQGGRANALGGSIVGTAIPHGTRATVMMNAADAYGLMGESDVVLENTISLPRFSLSSAAVLTSIASAGTFTFDPAVTPALWNWGNTAAAQVNGHTWIVQKIGDLAVYLWNGAGAAPALAGVTEGAWVRISGALNTANQGQFRVLAASATSGHQSFWVENPSAVEEETAADLWFLSEDSLLPGDLVRISHAGWGAQNMGDWTVASIDPSNRFGFTVSVAARTPVAYTGSTPIGTDAPLVQFIEGKPARIWKRLLWVAPSTENPSLVHLRFDTGASHTRITSAAGTVLRALNRLDLPTSVAQGVDGYKHSVGLVGEAARILYGDPRDPASYPGVVAAGASVNISGPLVKRVKAAFAVRVRSGASTGEVIDAVRSAVAAAVNKVAIGQPIAISSLISAAGGVNGVVAVSVTSPTYSAAQDLISVQPYEKALVTNPEQDIAVSIVGN